MGQRFTWKKAEKLKSRKRIERVFREGKSFSLFPYRVIFLLERPVEGVSGGALAPRPDDGPGLGDSPGPGDALAPGDVLAPGDALAPGGTASGATRSDWAFLQAGFGASSRHFKKAVDRNRIKRLGREAYRLQKGPLLQRLTEKGLSLAVFFIYTGRELPEYATVSEKIGVILQKLIKEIA
jgi:ribonuclease P protein component